MHGQRCSLPAVMTVSKDPVWITGGPCSLLYPVEYECLVGSAQIGWAGTRHSTTERRTGNFIEIGAVYLLEQEARCGIKRRDARQIRCTVVCGYVDQIAKRRSRIHVQPARDTATGMTARACDIQDGLDVGGEVHIVLGRHGSEIVFYAGSYLRLRRPAAVIGSSRSGMNERGEFTDVLGLRQVDQRDAHA